MKRLNFLLSTAGGLAIVANPEHVFARALAQAPLPGLPGSEDRSRKDALNQKTKWTCQLK